MPAIPRVARDVSVVGLDIGTSLIKAVEMRSVRGAIQLLNVAIRPTPPEVISNGVVVDAQTLGTAVKGLLGSQGIRTRAVVSSVAGQSSLVVRPIEVPKMTRAELDDTMRWEVERHIPFAASEVIMDYQPLVEPEELPESQQNMEVLLAVAQEDMINAHIEVLQVAGLEPRALDIEPLATSRSLVDIEAESGAYDRTIALINMGASTTDISILRNGLLSFTRPIPLAGDSLSSAISEALGVDEAEAERLKKEFASVQVSAGGERQDTAAPPPQPSAPPVAPVAPAPSAPSAPEEGMVAAPQAEEAEGEEGQRPVFDLSAELEDQMPARRPAQGPQPAPSKPAQAAAEPPASLPPPAQEPPQETAVQPAPLEQGQVQAQRVRQAMMPTLSEMVGEIRRSLEYFHTRYPEDRVDKVVLFGGTARMGNLAAFLGNELGLTVEIGDPLANLSALPAHLSQSYMRDIGCLLPVAVGLGLREMLE